jgi:exopolysaccharide production protein ExoZ
MLGSTQVVLRKQEPPASSLSERATGALKLESIQYLRAVAASAVVVSHAANSLLGHTSHLINLDYGAYGVDIFFVVSGFIMYYTTFELDIRPGTFFLKRLIRIFPLYFTLSTVMFAMVVLSPASFNKESPDVLAYFESVFFVPHWNPRLHDLQPIIGQGWTLNYELFFYLLFAASLFVGNKLNAIAVVTVIGSLVIFGHLHPVEDPVFITYTSPLLFEFCLGIVVAASFVAPGKPNLRWPVALMVLLGAVTAYVYTFHADSYRSQVTRPLFIGLPCALLVTALVAIERRGRLPNSAFLALVGDASYSLYLVHGFVLAFGQRIWQRFVAINSVLSHLAFITLILAASVATALLVYRHLEVKLGRNLSAALRRLQCDSSATPADRVATLK